jgi:multicomponent Na+:H+ antiporter subunit E
MRWKGWLEGRPWLRSVSRLAVIAIALWLVMTEGAEVGPEAIVLLAAAVAAGMYYGPTHIYRWRPWQLVRFLLHFLHRSLLGGIDVALRAIRPRMPAQSILVRRPVRVPKGQPRTLLVSAISLMPGTLTADVEGDELVLHLLAPEMEREVDALEARVAALFAPGERVEPLG